MTTDSIREAESVTRSIARWGSLVAAFIFGVAFLIDSRSSWGMVSHHVVQIGLITTIFIGYALAWTQRFEVAGSVLALVSMFATIAFCTITYGVVPGLYFLAVGAPAAFHLLAVALHRAGTTRASA